VSMKVYLDDIRPCPEGWVLARSYEEAVELLKTGLVTEISLDHDLGEYYPGVVARSGYNVACWIEEAVYAGLISCPGMYCHSGARMIEQAIEAIRKRQM